MNRLVIIPSAKKVSKELEIEIGDIPSGMIPIGGKPAIAYISDFYLSHGFKISVAVDFCRGPPYLPITAYTNESAAD